MFVSIVVGVSSRAISFAIGTTGCGVEVSCNCTPAEARHLVEQLNDAIYFAEHGEWPANPLAPDK
jgi:hypothetical protein